MPTSLPGAERETAAEETPEEAPVAEAAPATEEAPAAEADETEEEPAEGDDSIESIVKDLKRQSGQS